MTAEIINLRNVRKQRARAEAGRKAEENRTKFGRTKVARVQENADKTRATKTLDGTKREPKNPEETQ